MLVLLAGQWPDRQTALPDQGDVFQLFIFFDSLERNGNLQGLKRHQIDTGPVALVGSWVGIRFFVDLSDADDLFVADAVIVEDGIALFHGTQVEPGGEIADTGPSSSSVLNKSGPGIRFGLLFDHPVLHEGYCES